MPVPPPPIPSPSYWYFPSKDALFCAVVERETFDRLGTLLEGTWASPAEIAELHDRLHETTGMLVSRFSVQKGLDEREASLIVTALLYLLEGMLMREQVEDSRADLLDLVLQRLSHE